MIPMVVFFFNDLKFIEKLLEIMEKIPKKLKTGKETPLRLYPSLSRFFHYYFKASMKGQMNIHNVPTGLHNRFEHLPKRMRVEGKFSIYKSSMSSQSMNILLPRSKARPLGRREPDVYSQKSG